MRKTLIGLLMASVIAGPALADDDDDRGRGKGKKHKIEREWRGGGDDDDRRGGWKRERWSRGDDYRPVRIVRVDRDWDDDDDDRRERWQDRRKRQREYYRALQRERRDYIREARRDWRDEQSFVPVERVIRVPAQRHYERQVYAPVRYAEPVVRYVQPRTRIAPGYADSGYDYAPVSYAPASTGLFGGAGGGGVLGALLPIVLQSALGGGDLSGLGGLTGLGGLADGGLGGLGGLAGLASPSVIPLDSLGYGADQGFGGFAGPLASGYVPASYGGGDLSSLLLPALLSQGGSLF